MKGFWTKISKFCCFFEDREVRNVPDCSPGPGKPLETPRISFRHNPDRTGHSWARLEAGISRNFLKIPESSRNFLKFSETFCDFRIFPKISEIIQNFPTFSEIFPKFSDIFRKFLNVYEMFRKLSEHCNLGT